MTTATLDPVVAFRNHALKLTLEWCKSRSPFYKDRFAHIQNFSGLEDLHKLPILRRDDVVKNRDAISCHPGPPACFQFTTGTTGTFLPLYRSAEEVQFISDFYSRRITEQFDFQRPRPLCMSIISAYHGASTPMPSAAYILTVGAYDRSQAETAKNLLQRTFNFPGVESRVSALIGFDILIKALTAYLVAEGVPLRSLGVRQIYTTGGYMSPATKLRLAELWHANVHDRLSMSEIFGGATEMYAGGPWVFDVEAVPEVVHPTTLKPVRKGVGALLMTSLYPFSQMSPMIRYDTGDLVEVVDETSAFEGNLIVRFRGRRRRSIINTDGEEVEPLVLSTDLADTVEMWPDIAITPHFTYIKDKAVAEFVGKPHCELSAALSERAGSISIKLGLRYSPWLFPERATQIKTEFARTLIDRSPSLARGIQEGRLTLQIDLASADQVATYSTE